MSLRARYMNGMLIPVQYGQGLNGLAFYKTQHFRQKGHGLGGFFRAIARKIVPFAKQVVVPFAKEHVLPHAKTAAKSMARDILDGRNFKESLSHNTTAALKAVGNDLLTQSGSGVRRKRKRAKSISKSKKRKVAGKFKSLFD